MLLLVQVLFFSAGAMNHGGLKRGHLWVVEFIFDIFGEGYTPEIQHKYRKWWFGRCIWIQICLIWDTLQGGAKRNCHVTNFQSQNSASIYRRMPLPGQNAIHEFRSLAPFKEPWKSINSAMPHAIRYDLIYGKAKASFFFFFFFSMFACCWGLIYSLKLPPLKLLPCCGRHLNRQDTPLFQEVQPGWKSSLNCHDLPRCILGTKINKKSINFLSDARSRTT